MRILSLDPGKNVDPFAGVILDVTNETITIKAARFWLGVSYPDVEQQIAKIYQVLKVDRIVCESNSMGDHVIDSLKRNYQLPVYKVWTGRHTKTQKSGVMDKMDMLMWMNRMVQDQKIIWPTAEEDNQYTKELKRQWAIFGEYKKDKVEAPPNEHDDLVLALMLGCFYARHNIMRGDKSTAIVESKKFNIVEKGHADFKTVLPEGAIPISDSTMSWSFPHEM